ncbi:Molybdenum cofactor synthesis protein 1 [Phlyctochytrium bullatum]|nr:Molybdenum cofactor synthesis protein 1 [Phlyctochytrium bullatum]
MNTKVHSNMWAKILRRGVSSFTHVDATGKLAMVNVAHKDETHRVARATGRVMFSNSHAFQLLKANKVEKGDVLTTAHLAGIHAAKETGRLIPLAHNINLTKVGVDFDFEEKNHALVITASVETVGRTGVEVEAMVAVSMAACTVFDMCKAVDKSIKITDVRVVYKSGGKSGTFISQ